MNIISQYLSYRVGKTIPHMLLFQFQNSHNLKTLQSTAIGTSFCTSSHVALHLCRVQLKHLEALGATDRNRTYNKPFCIVFFPSLMAETSKYAKQSCGSCALHIVLIFKCRRSVLCCYKQFKSGPRGLTRFGATRISNNMTHLMISDIL